MINAKVHISERSGGRNTVWHFAERDSDSTNTQLSLSIIEIKLRKYILNNSSLVY